MHTEGDTYQVGVATADITPEVGVVLAGFANRVAPSEGIDHPLRVNAVAISDEHDAMLIVVIEWLGFYEHTPHVRALIADRVSIDPSRIMLLGTHTHFAPVFRDIDIRRGGAVDDAYLTSTFESVADCAARAWASRSAARLRVGTGTCDIGASRRKPNAVGGVDWSPNLESPYDHTVTVVAVDYLGGARDVLFSYACHPTSNQANRIGGDYVGFAMEAIEALMPGTTATFLQGCAGDQKVAATDPQTGGYRRLSTAEVRETGRTLADVVLNTLQQPLHAVTGPLTLRQLAMRLRTKPLNQAIVARHLTSDDHHGDWARHIQAQLNAGSVSTEVPFELQTAAFGSSFAIVAMAGEMVVEYALRLKRDLAEHFTCALPIGYANDIVGYIPVRRQIPEGGYEVTESNFWYLHTGPYVSDTEDQIVAATLDLLEVKQRPLPDSTQ